jgi:hypothetical protein
MKTRDIAALITLALLLSAALPALAQIQTDSQTKNPPTAVRDPFQEEYQPCTNARYRAWFGAS